MLFRSFLEVRVDAVVGEPEIAARLAGIVRVGGQRARHQLIIAVDTRGDAVDIADEGAVAAAHHAVIVVEPSALSLRGIGPVADLVDQVWDDWNPDLELTGVIVNKVPAVSAEADRRLDDLARIVGKRAIWQPTIPQRVIVNQAIGERRPIHAYGSRATDITEVFDRLWSKLRKAIKD